MASATAMKKHQGGIAEYRASEGKTISIPYRFIKYGKILGIKK
jgi:GMP reductase